MHSQYRFSTTFTIAAPIAHVHQHIVELEPWLAGFPDIEEHRTVSRGGADRIGDRVEVVHRAPKLSYRLHYTLETVAHRPPDRLTWRVDGDLTGTGTWELEPLDDVTDCRFLWEVTTSRRWMRAAAPLARPLFVREHDRSMRTGVEAFGHLLGAGVSRYRCREGKHVPTTVGSARLAAGLLLLGTLAGRR